MPKISVLSKSEFAMVVVIVVVVAVMMMVVSRLHIFYTEVSFKALVDQAIKHA